jgi:hypothetical protein
MRSDGGRPADTGDAAAITHIVDMVRQRRWGPLRPVPRTMAAITMTAATIRTAIGSVPGDILINPRRDFSDGGR